MSLFIYLDAINDFIWGYAGFFLIFLFGIYFTFTSGFYQIRKLPAIFLDFISQIKQKDQTSKEGLHPIKVFFAAIGGCIGIGNIVGICTAVQIGGPGALFWTWIAAFLGMILQYSEVFLGMRYRVKNPEGGYSGGPMYFLPKAFKGKWVGIVVSLLLCVYGVEIFMFNVITDSVSTNWHLSKPLVVFLLFGLVMFAAKGGIKRVSDICSAIIPLFILIYVGMTFWILVENGAMIPSLLKTVFEGAFTSQAAQGAFAGSSIMLAISMGLSRGAYSGDIGVGYTSVIHAESRSQNPQKQASLTIIGIFLDTFIVCTLSIFLVLATGTWKEPLDVTLMVQNALAHYFPFMDIFMPFFLFSLGYTTIISYFVVGLKCAKFISGKYGPLLYYTYAALALPIFSFVSAQQAFIIMSLVGAFLLMFNLIGTFLLRKEIYFEEEAQKLPASN